MVLPAKVVFYWLRSFNIFHFSGSGSELFLWTWVWQAMKSIERNPARLTVAHQICNANHPNIGIMFKNPTMNYLEKTPKIYWIYHELLGEDSKNLLNLPWSTWRRLQKSIESTMNYLVYLFAVPRNVMKCHGLFTDYSRSFQLCCVVYDHAVITQTWLAGSHRRNHLRPDAQTTSIKSRWFYKIVRSTG